MCLRRAAAGQCYYQPFLGCREFSVSQWELEPKPPEAIPESPPERDYGVVFRDFDFDPVWNHWGHAPNTSRPEIGWNDHDKRPRQLPPLRAVARHGWITVAVVKNGKVEEAV
jgi:hypothetical protein